MGCPPGHLEPGEIRPGDGRQKAEKDHGRNLLLFIPCLLNLEDEACRPGQEGMVSDRQQPELAFITVLAPDLPCHAWPTRAHLLHCDSTASSTFRPVVPTTGPAPAHTIGTVGIWKRKQSSC